MNSRKKHNINFTKPAEPAFITRMKKEAGYVEGPSVETKKEQLPEFNEDDFQVKDDEKPVVVVMNEGDLTAEEAETIEKVQKQIAAKEEKADLSQKIVFKRKKESSDKNKEQSKSTEESKESKRKKQKTKVSKSVLSFNEEDEEV
ncbi:unnamed protein product [Trichogramma brassicae]|uniref:DUF4604 domain-containing protein n=1 Tax=Trichogramma brassicae TaxID=86971 RepID=A0A6H5HV97_9HYME|nr:unnamed protein product [Trichogramma brassicae]